MWQNGGDAGVDIVAAMDGGVADGNTGNVGDGVERSARQNADLQTQVRSARAHGWWSVLSQGIPADSHEQKSQQPENLFYRVHHVRHVRHGHQHCNQGCIMNAARRTVPRNSLRHAEPIPGRQAGGARGYLTSLTWTERRLQSAPISSPILSRADCDQERRFGPASF